jgi:hypothetical protein
MNANLAGSLAPGAAAVGPIIAVLPNTKKGACGINTTKSSDVNVVNHIYAKNWIAVIACIVEACCTWTQHKEIQRSSSRCR